MEETAKVLKESDKKIPLFIGSYDVSNNSKFGHNLESLKLPILRYFPSGHWENAIDYNLSGKTDRDILHWIVDFSEYLFWKFLKLLLLNFFRHHIELHEKVNEDIEI